MHYQLFVYLCSCVVHHLLGGQITFVSYQEFLYCFAGILISFLKPLFNMDKWLLICYVVYINDPMCASIIAETWLKSPSNILREINSLAKMLIWLNKKIIVQSVEKWKTYCPTKKNFRQINSFVFSFEKTLILRIFCDSKFP